MINYEIDNLKQEIKLLREQVEELRKIIDEKERSMMTTIQQKDEIIVEKTKMIEHLMSLHR